jgi:eukaryotic-like serine/threonine-protein kinase
MVTRNGDIKVMDFGIARAMSDAQATMTQTAQVIGTAQYLSPEQARGERVDARSDLYSAGCLLYELLTGRPPFTGDSPVAIAYQHVRENPVPPSRVDPDVPAWADAIVLKAMAKSPADRYQTAGDMRADLQRAASGMPVSAPPTRLDNYPRTQRMGTGAMMAGTTQIPAVEDYDYAGGRYDRGGRGRGGGSSSSRWIPWVVGLVIVLGVVGGVAYYLLAGGGQTYAVPLVNGLSVTSAQNEIKAAHLRSTVVDQANATVRKNYVISSNPPQGNNEPANTLVTLYVSSGPGNVTVPNVQGKLEIPAETTLQNAGFTVVVQQDSTSTEPAGTVVSQSPAGNTQVAPGSKVTIYVSGAASVPSVVGLSQASAQTSLQSAGFKVNVTTVAGPAGTTPGDVWQQNPAAQATEAPGTIVSILVQPAASPPPASPTPTPTGSGGTGTGF